MELDALLARPGLPGQERLLVAAKVSICRADWSRLTDCVAWARDHGVARELLVETLLQAVLFYGFPRVVSAFEVLQRAWPGERAPHGGALPDDRQHDAGRALFAAIYGDNEDTVRAMLRSFHQDFHDFVLEQAYGRVLSRPAIAPRLRELLAVGALAALDQMPQLVAHGRGALRFGATLEEVTEAAFCALLDEETARRVARKIDRGGSQTP